jgi:hypothetical protein
MRFVPVKSEEQQGMLMVHRTRDLLVRQRTAAVNALRGHLAEFGITAAKGAARARELMSLVGTDERVPAIAEGEPWPSRVRRGRRRRLRDASHQILIGQLGNRDLESGLEMITS